MEMTPLIYEWAIISNYFIKLWWSIDLSQAQSLFSRSLVHQKEKDEVQSLDQERMRQGMMSEEMAEKGA